MNLQSKERLREKLADKEYRDAFVASRIAQTVALQVRVLRQRAGLSQDDLAKQLGTSQNAVSRVENPRYGKPSISTLRKIASFFNVGLVVRFSPISEIVDWTMNLSSHSVDVPDFEHDSGFVEHKAPYSEGFTMISIKATGTSTAEAFDVIHGNVPRLKHGHRDVGHRVISMSQSPIIKTYLGGEYHAR